MKLVRFFLAALCVLTPYLAFAQNKSQNTNSITRLGELVDQGNMEQAYELGKADRDSYGEAKFDLLFGIAAVESGHVGEGVMALERFVIENADNVPGRLQLARGYFLLGDDARARQEFTALRDQQLTADVDATVDRYLDAIRLRESRYSLTRGFYLEAGLGTNSNINAGVPDANINLPLLGDVLIASGGTEQADTVYQLGVGGYASIPLQAGLSFYVNGQADLRYNASTNNVAYDQNNYSLNSGLSWINDKHLVRSGLIFSYVDVGHEAYVTTNGMELEWQYQLSPVESVSVSNQIEQLSYAGDNQPRNANFVGLSFGYRRLFSQSWQPTLNVTIITGQQFSITGRDDLVPTTIGLSSDLSFTPGAQWGVSLGVVTINSQYGAADPLLGVTRNDTYNAFNAAASYLVNRKLSVRAEASLARNNSNIELYSYPRETYSVKVRYEFK